MDNNEEQIINQTESLEKTELKSKPKSITEERNDKIDRINSELSQINYNAESSEEIDAIQNQREEDYQNELRKLGGMHIGELSKKMIHQKMVVEHIEHAKTENDRYKILNKEKKELILYNNLELGKNAEEVVDRAKSLVSENDPNGGRTRIFEKALDYYSNPQERIAEMPIYHSTGSYGLYKIIESGAIDSSKNILTGEQSATGESHGGTSLAIGGYEESEVVSHFYARKNEKSANLILDSKEVLGDPVASERSVVDTIFKQLPNLKSEEKNHIQKYFDEKNEEISKQRDKKVEGNEFVNAIVEYLEKRKYYFEYEEAKMELTRLKEKVGKIINDKKYEEYVDKKINELENKISNYEQGTDEERDLLDNPYGAILVYEGNNLPKEDLENFTSGLICERRTSHPIFNNNIKEIHVPIKQIEQVKQWLEKRKATLSENSDEKISLENVKIIPLEYFEAKSIIKKIK